MISDIKTLQRAVDEGDIETLDSFLFPRRRKINTSTGFHSALMLSANNIRHLNKIPELNAGCIILNLEDGVSVEQKPFALRLCALALSSLPECSKKLVVRVNALDEGGREEIGFLNIFRPDAIRVPKIRSVDDVKNALELLDGEIELHLSIETKEAWLALGSLAVNERVKVYYLGILDLFADMGLSQKLIHPDNPAMHYMLSHFLATTKAAGVKPVSFVFQDYKDEDTFHTWLTLEKKMGFDAKGCLSPTQSEAANSMFGIDKESLRQAKEIIRLFEEMRKTGTTGFSHPDYGFIDEPIYKGALALLQNDTGQSKV